MPKSLKLGTVLTYLTFIISFGIYLLTLERTVSLWDCGEFIASATGLQIGHPPGAPLYAMVARVFAAVAPGSQHVALFVNSFSALASALTITFLYKSILLLFAISAKNEVKSQLAIQLSAFAAAMTFAFTDTFWFSAVEAEVYAFSLLFTAACFWAVLKWYTLEDGNIHSRWLILIAYLCGLSYGVHLLNLLIIPAILFLIISKCYHLSTGKKLLAIAVSSLGVGAVMYFFVPLLLWVISRIELLFVNQIGLPYNSGTLFGVFAIFAAMGWLLWFSFTRGHAKTFLFTVSFALFTLGFASYAMVLIRGIQNPPMNQNQPDNIFSLKYYLDRDQYGKTPLLYGPYYSAPVKAVVADEPIYVKIDGRYEIKGYTSKVKYYSSHCTIFPRMHSNVPNHIGSYRSWADIQEDSVTYKTVDGKAFKEIKPTFTQNLTFFAGYQMWWMYFRYLLWNFSGRQNEFYGNGNILNGNFITGFPAIDNLMLGPQDELPDAYKNNAANNRYFLIPLLLGLIGIYYQWKRHENLFITTLLLFFFTGIAIVLFLNQTPLQARERDYAYVGSFYVFAIWIGYGLLFLSKKLEKIKATSLRNIAALSFIGVPALVLAQNYDDHDRSGRSIALNYAKNFLNSVPKNSLLVVYGDNDTFPVWYAQMVEGVRQDVKVVNSNYLPTSWQPGQLAYKTYTNDGFKMDGTSLYAIPDEFRHTTGKDSLMPPVPLQIAMLQIFSSDSANRVPSPLQKGKMVRYLPQDVIVLPGLTRKDSNNIYLANNQILSKEQIIYLDIINRNYPERTINYAQTVPEQSYKLLQRNLSRVGLNHELIIRAADSTDSVNRAATLRSYNFLMNHFSFDKLDKPQLLDEVSVRCIASYRTAFIRTAAALANAGDTAKATALIAKCNKNIPVETIPLGSKEPVMVKLLLDLKQNRDALLLVNYLSKENLQMLHFIEKLNSFQKRYVFAEKALALQNLDSFAEILVAHGYTQQAMKIKQQIDKYDK